MHLNLKIKIYDFNDICKELCIDKKEWNHHRRLGDPDGIDVFKNMSPQASRFISYI